MKLSKWLMTLLAAAGFALAPAVQAQEEIVVGGSIPMTGVFAFAGVGVNAGMQDYFKIVNDAGGIFGGGFHGLMGGRGNFAPR